MEALQPEKSPAVLLFTHSFIRSSIYIAISYICLPGLQRKLSVCKQRGEGEEKVVNTAVVEHKLRLQSMPVEGV